MLPKVIWYYKRLRLMSPAEIVCRAKNSFLAMTEKVGLIQINQIPEPDQNISFKTWISRNIDVPQKPYIQAADRILSGHIPIFSLADARLGVVSDWNRDPLSGIKTPLLFGKTIDYRNPDLVGDIKYLWEPNRHLQLVALAQSYRLTGDQHYLDGLATQLDSWFDQCPYLKGPNWTSSLELGIRLINWSFVWSFIGGLESAIFKGKDGERILNRWLKSIYQHLHFIQGYYSRFSSANNHLIGEAAGVFVATTTWPFWKDFEKWHKKARDILIEEALKQNTPDGVNREQAISYQQFVLDFLIISALAGKQNGIEFPEDYWNRIEAMLEYIASVMDVAGNVPMIGDADDGYVVKLSQEEAFCPYKSLLATGAVLFKRGDFKKKAGRLDDKTRWLLGDRAEEIFEGIEAKSSKLKTQSEDECVLSARKAFADGGYYILGKDFEKESEVRCMVDCGPLGYLSIAAHGHADALSVYLSVAGREFLIDPGTYAYHANKKWRDYFRGTSAHNTVCVDRQNQSVIGGNFMWTRKANTWCEVWEPGEKLDRFAGCHNGYMRLDNPVLHRREVEFLKSEKRIIITDVLKCEGRHEIERFWHFSEPCDVNKTDNNLIVINAGIKIILEHIEHEGDLYLHKGDDTTPLGWVSRCFDVKVPSFTAVCKNVIHGTSSLETVINIDI